MIIKPFVGLQHDQINTFVWYKSRQFFFMYLSTCSCLLIKLIFQTTLQEKILEHTWSAFGSRQLLQKYIMIVTSHDAKDFHLLSPARAAGFQY